jgi:hypothetical protein
MRIVEPIMLGGGKQVFPSDGQAPAPELVSATTTGTGVLICTYRRRWRCKPAPDDDLVVCGTIDML